MRVRCIPIPNGVTAPSPVTTTRRISVPQALKSHGTFGKIPMDERKDEEVV